MEVIKFYGETYELRSVHNGIKVYLNERSDAALNH